MKGFQDFNHSLLLEWQSTLILLSKIWQKLDRVAWACVICNMCFMGLCYIVICSEMTSQSSQEKFHVVTNAY